MKTPVGMIVQAVLAGLLIGCALMVFLLGVDFLAITIYHLFPMDVRNELYAAYPPQTTFSMTLSQQAMIALSFFAAGSWLAAGLWTSYPNLKAPIVVITLALWLYSFYVFNYVYSHLKFF